MSSDRFHGRIGGSGRLCSAPGCDQPGEFRAPGVRPPGFDGPGEYRWFCLDHIRQFNAGYDFFKGMTQEQIMAAQSPLSGWETQTRAFRPDAGIDQAPRWADFNDPLEAIARRARARREDHHRNADAARRGLNPADRRAYDVLGLGFDADRKVLRQRYSELVRRYHPDRNGGDRSHEARLQEVVDAYNHLRKHGAFGG
ncbi:J domain-containing protein [Novosphingobium sp. FKTRR1]|uniref:J domain-containing protein n=1 Tax=unclassified Novosphingobium TaxID=2644732 RepID=UPI001CF017BB|nr:J domain-containing protein [Novosphingobium sp. FKTRR1]